MNAPSLKLVVVETDPLLRRGLDSWLAEMALVQSVSTFASYEGLYRDLSDLAEVDIFVLGSSEAIPPNLLATIRRKYPDVGLLFISDRPVALLSSSSDSPKNKGAVGYCPRSRLSQELESAITALAEGRFYSSVYLPQSSNSDQLIPLTPWQLLRHNLRVSAVQRIDHTLQNLPPDQGVPLWQRWMLNGRKRELRSARWLIAHILLPEPPMQAVVSASPVPDEAVLTAASMSTGNFCEAIFAAIADKIRHPQQTLSNLSPSPMEIDILRPKKKRELLLAVWHQWQLMIQELKTAEIGLNSLNYDRILRNLWQESATGFLGRYFRIGDTNVLDQVLTERENLELMIPQFPELIAHLVQGQPLTVDNASWTVGSPTAMRHTEQLTENLIITIANAVMQAVLNNFAHAEVMKQQFYQHNLLATRDIERFRNDLSWKFRRWKYVDEPRAIFESYYTLLIITEMGLRQHKVYAPRNQELESLQGLRYGITILWEFQDAIAPRIKALASWAGSVVVYVLTNIVGRGLGLIGRGILQGIGSAFQDNSRRIQG